LSRHVPHPGTTRRDRRTAVLYPDGTYHSFTYDEIGNLSAARGRACFTYEPLNRLRLIERPPFGQQSTRRPLPP